MRICFALLAVAVATLAVSAQTVTVEPHKIIYKRPRPQEEFRKEFTIMYPRIKASTPALSRRIEQSVSYDSVIDLRLKDELADQQWLDKADYKVQYNRKGILCLELWMEGISGYQSIVSKVVCVDTRTGTRARPASVFKDLRGLTAMVRRAQEREKRDAIPQIKKREPEIKDPSLLFGDIYFTSEDLDGYEITDNGVIFHYNYEFPRVAHDLEPKGAFFFSWARLRPYIKQGGLLTRIAR